MSAIAVLQTCSLLAGAYLTILGLLLNTKNLRSFVLFQAGPVVIGFAGMTAALKWAGIV